MIRNINIDVRWNIYWKWNDILDKISLVKQIRLILLGFHVWLQCIQFHFYCYETCPERKDTSRVDR